MSFTDHEPGRPPANGPARLSPGLTGSHIIAGAGLAGLSLACGLDEGVLGKITLVDRRTSFEADRTRCMWDVGPLRWRELARHRWPTWSIVSDTEAATAASWRHPYMQLDAADLYEAAQARLCGQGSRADSRHARARAGRGRRAALGADRPRGAERRSPV